MALFPNTRPFHMAKKNNNNPYSSSPSSFRFHGYLKQSEPDPFNPRSDPIELHESDVVWSFSPVTSPPSHHHHHNRHRINPSKSGLSAALIEDEHHLIRRKSTINAKAIPQTRRIEDIPAAATKFHQSAPVNIPIWPKQFRRGNYNNENVKWFDDVEEEENYDEVMVPPHVIVARSHVTNSVFEGVGRTLKGRDLRRVRNAVFRQTGFID